MEVKIGNNWVKKGINLASLKFLFVMQKIFFIEFIFNADLILKWKKILLYHMQDKAIFTYQSQIVPISTNHSYDYRHYLTPKSPLNS